MNRKIVILIGLIVVLTLATTTIVFAGHPSGIPSGVKKKLAAVRAATARFHRTEVAQAEGWDLVPGLDHCFENPGVGAMGYHYINTALLDTVLDPLRPEAMVYAPGPHGKLLLAAVEYIVPADAWDGEGHPSPPALHGQSFHLNEALGVYVLHAWIWMHNPAGLFEDWNPQVTCP
jgi:hypothetical protein